MTVSTELSHEEYTGNGVTTDFDFRFRILKAEHLVVSVADQDGTERTLTNGTDYTLRGAGSYRGGKVILKMPLATGWKIGIARALPVVQETDLRNQGKFFAEVHEDAFDYLTMLIQKSLGYLSLCLRKPSFISDHYDAKGNKISNLGKPVKDGDAVDLGTMTEHISAKDKRSLRVADKDIPALPNGANRANKLLSFDNIGNPIVIVPESGSAADVLAELAKPTGASLVGVSNGSNLAVFVDVDDWRRFNSVRGYGVSGDDLMPINDHISTADNPVLFTVPAGAFTGNFTWKSGFGLIGSGSQSTIINVPSGQSGIVMSSQIVRGGEISKMTIATESPTAGRGIDGNTRGMVNCRFSDLYLNKFDIGYKAGATDFSCTFDNVRANECRISFDLTGGGGLIQNVFNNCYSSAPSELGLNIAGVKGVVFNCYNSGSTGARHVLIGLGSKGVIFNSPNFEQDAGYLGVNQAAVTILSSSEVILNSPNFVSPAGAPGSTNTYLVRVQDSAVVHINMPTVIGEGSNIKHLYVAGNAVVYLNDPLGVFSKINVQGSGRVIRTHKISNAPDYIGKHLAVKSGDIINFGFAPRHIVAVPDFSNVAVPNPFVRSVHFDTYGSLTAVARIVNTTTGAIDTAGSLNILVQAWS